MSLLNGALQIGKSGISAAQAALTVTGNNIANAATTGYARQSTYLSPASANTALGSNTFTGSGVSISEIRRQVDEALNSRLRSATSDTAGQYVLYQAMSRVETAFNELTESDISTQLNAFFQSWSDLANDPTSSAAQEVVLQEGASLAGRIQSIREDLTDICTDLDLQVRDQVSQVNSLLESIADLNERIITTESGQIGAAASLRDQRDQALSQLSEYVDFTTRQSDNGAMMVFIGNDLVIQNTDYRAVGYVEDTDAATGASIARFCFTDNESSVTGSGGKLFATIDARDTYVGDVISDLDDWTSNLILAVNQLHSGGSSATGFAAMTSQSLDDTTASLGDMTSVTGTGLPWAVTNGVFNVHITNASGVTTTHQIKVDVDVDATDTTLTDLKDALNAIDGLAASLSASGALVLSSESAGQTFSFSTPADSGAATNVLAVLGLNTFFSGSTAVDIAVRSDLSGANLGTSDAGGLSGNHDIAAAIAALDSSSQPLFGNQSAGESFSDLISRVAADTRLAMDGYEAASAVGATLETEYQSISGVSVDEEAVYMIMYQSAFQGSARYLSLVQEMLDEVLGLLG